MRAALSLAVAALVLPFVAAGATGCGPSYRYGTAMISAPAVPSNSNASGVGTQCKWDLEAATNRTIVIYFTAFNLNKNRDSLSVYSGNQLVAQYSGSSVPPNLNLGSKAKIVFQSDDTNKRAVSFLFVSRELACGGYHVVNSSRTNGFVITSPGYPSLYPRNADCTWTVAFSGGKMRLKFTFIELSPGNRDKLTVYDGASLVQRFGNSVRQPPAYSLGKTATITFRTNPRVQMRGFRAVFSSVG